MVKEKTSFCKSEVLTENDNFAFSGWGEGGVDKASLYKYEVRVVCFTIETNDFYSTHNPICTVDVPSCVVQIGISAPKKNQNHDIYLQLELNSTNGIISPAEGLKM